MIKKEHLKPDRIKALKDGLLTTGEVIDALEHIGECERCADALGESYSEKELLNLPPDFITEVFSAIKKDSIGLTRKEKSRRWKKELYSYSFKVSIAASIALVLLFSGTLDYGINFSRSIHSDLSGVNVITENLRGFSDKLIDFNGFTNLKEEL